MVPSRKFFILFVFLCLSSAAMSYADAEDKSFYFDGDGSGDGNHISTEFPTDDEDIDEGSGKPDLVNIDVSESIIPVKSGPKKINEEPIEIEPIEKNIARDDGTNEEVKSEPGIGVGVAGAASMHFIAAIVVGGCIGLLFAVCVVMLLVYRMRKKDEGSYALEYGLDKKPQGAYEYTKGVDSKEYFA